MARPLLPSELYRAIIREEARARWSEENRHKFRFLELPAELRNLIYECAADGLVLTQNLLDPAVPCRCRYAMLAGQLLEFDARPHPLLRVCRQIRSEFIPFLTGSGAITNMRAAAAVDYNFGPLLEHLRRYPALHSPCQLEIQLRFTEDGSEDWHSLLHWIQMCQPTCPDGTEDDDESKYHIIHGSLYYVKFFPDPNITRQGRLTVQDRLSQFSDEISDWDIIFWVGTSSVMESRIANGMEL